MARAIGRSRLFIERGDITRCQVDAIVNAANSSLTGGGGVDGAIHRAGGKAILEECRKIVASKGQLPPGRAVMTTGGRLPARHVIHTVGPIWHGGGKGEAATLASAYRESLRVAERGECRTIAFPSISTGAYRYPVDQAAPIALTTVAEHLGFGSPIREAHFVLFDAATLAAYESAADDLCLRDSER